MKAVGVAEFRRKMREGLEEAKGEGLLLVRYSGSEAFVVKRVDVKMYEEEIKGWLYKRGIESVEI